MIKNCEEAVVASKRFAGKHWPDIEHILQVTKIASELFDGLINVHNLGPQERCWLECAAVLHDTGLSKGVSGHHKESAKLILNDSKLPFTSEERRIIASVARYHRKGLPKQKHCNLASLDKASVSKIKILASLLRVADGLDYTHESIVKSINLKVGARKITAEYVSKKQSVLDEQAFNKKKDLFEKVFAKKLVLVWKKP
jgi:exopolyphosphatase/guanosine-5'-triphosphate,3'-diphosphate pyrophosphatase